MSKAAFMMYYLYDTQSDTVVRTELDYLPYVLMMYEFYAGTGCIQQASQQQQLIQATWPRSDSQTQLQSSET